MQTANIKLILLSLFSLVYLEYLILKALVLEIAKLKINYIFPKHIVYFKLKNLKCFSFFIHISKSFPISGLQHTYEKSKCRH